MAVRIVLVLLMLVGLAPAGECSCAICVSARLAAAAHPDRAGMGPALASAFPAEHDHDDDHPVHHHPNCPEVHARLGLLIALAPAPFSTPSPFDFALAVWGVFSPEPSVGRCCIRFTGRPSARALPLYLSQSALQI